MLSDTSQPGTLPPASASQDLSNIGVVSSNTGRCGQLAIVRTRRARRLPS
jgi:hypothetical protein